MTVNDEQVDEHTRLEETHNLKLEEFVALKFSEALHEIHQITTQKGKRKKTELKPRDMEKAIELVSIELSEMLKGTGDELILLRLVKSVGEKLKILDKVFP